jgi:hypothetical protein
MERTTRRPLRLAAAGLTLLLLPACSTLNRYGIGGDPLLTCRKGEASIDDKLVGTDAARLTVLRRFKDGDALCPK